MGIIQGTAEDIVLKGKTLWTGSWSGSSKSIEVPDTDKYTLFQITMSRQGTTVLAMKHNNYIRGNGGYISSSGTPLFFLFGATFNGNIWTLENCASIKPNTDHTKTNLTITSIAGII